MIEHSKYSDGSAALAEPSAIEDEERSTSPEHLVRLSDEWAVWQWAGLRGSGFPVEGVLKLSTPDSAAGVDRLLDAEERAKQAHKEAMVMLQRDIDRADAGTRAALIKAISRLKKRKRPARLAIDGEAAPSIAALIEAQAKVESARTEFQRAFEAEAVKVSCNIREVARADSFREAIAWQNRRALHGSIDALLRMPPDQTSRSAERKKREEVVANYLQRYCTKNDTIGFFGPVGWARLTPGGVPIDLRPGSSLLAERNVYLEVWCIDALAEALARDKTIRPWVVPRRVSIAYLDGLKLYLPSKSPIQLSPLQASLFEACDGTRTAKEVARHLLQNPFASLKSESEVYCMLDFLCSRGLMSWKLEVPIELHPERTLRRVIERIDDEKVRSAALGPIDEMEAALALVAGATGDADRLDKAIGNLEDTFTRLTGLDSTRSAGEMYAGRTLVYEDCRRDVELEIGPDVVESLGPALSLLLTGARWFSYNTARVTEKLFGRIYLDLAHKANSKTVDFATFWYRLYPVIFGDQKQPGDVIIPSFQERWERVLSIDWEKHRIEYTSDELRGRVHAAFNAPGSGWKSVIYHSPDVMIAAPSAEAIGRGDYQFVLGEMHPSVNTLRFALFPAQHPSPEELFFAFEMDHPQARPVPLIPRSYWPVKASRLLPALVASKDYRVEFFPEPSDIPRSRILPIGELVVESEGDGLVLRSRDGRLRFDLIEIFSETPTLNNAYGFMMLKRRPHTPRITIDRLVICRESWSFFPAELDFAREKGDADRFIAARRWARAHGIPRFVFVKSPAEMKPFYVDFDSPIYIDIFAKVVRRTKQAGEEIPSITVTEMLPLPDETWLSDGQGNHYTSELRMVALESRDSLSSV